MTGFARQAFQFSLRSQRRECKCEVNRLAQRDESYPVPASPPARGRIRFGCFTGQVAVRQNRVDEGPPDKQENGAELNGREIRKAARPKVREIIAVPGLMLAGTSLQ